MSFDLYTTQLLGDDEYHEFWSDKDDEFLQNIDEFQGSLDNRIPQKTQYSNNWANRILSNLTCSQIS